MIFDNCGSSACAKNNPCFERTEEVQGLSSVYIWGSGFLLAVNTWPSLSTMVQLITTVGLLACIYKCIQIQVKEHEANQNVIFPIHAVWSQSQYFDHLLITCPQFCIFQTNLNRKTAVLLFFLHDPVNWLKPTFIFEVWSYFYFEVSLISANSQRNNTKLDKSQMPSLA